MSISKLEQLKTDRTLIDGLVSLWNWYVDCSISTGFHTEEEAQGLHRIHRMCNIEDYVTSFSYGIPDNIPLGGLFDIDDPYFMIIEGYIQSFDYKTIRAQINNYQLADWLNFMILRD